MSLTPGKALEILQEVNKRIPGAIIAGGFLRDILLRREPKDLDIFVPYQGEAGVFQGAGAAPMAGCYDMTGEVFSVWELPGYALPVQIIEMQSGLSPEERAAKHDFGICQVWMTPEGNWNVTPEFHLDSEANVFTLRVVENQGEFNRSMRRWLRLREKYADWKLVIPEEFQHYLPFWNQSKHGTVPQL